MPPAPVRPWPRPAIAAIYLIGFAAICAILYLGRLVLIPLALASLIAFLLSPLVARLQRLKLPRVAAVILVVSIAALFVGGVGWIVTREIVSLANELPTYKNNIKEKISDLKSMMRGGVVEKVRTTIDDISTEIEKDEGEDKESADEDLLEKEDVDPSEKTAPLPLPLPFPQSQYVERAGATDESLKEDSDSALLDESQTAMAASILELAANAGAVIVLVIFMLLAREDLRNRVVSLGGHTSLALTTKALDEAGKRISRFLLAQFILNASMGIAVAAGLFLIGVPYAALWGLCAGLLRYIPYLGPTIAAALPLAVSLITSSGWTQVAIVAGLFIVLELVSNNVMEPLLYGQSVGLSAMAVIVAALFWTWLWGPLGLMLATPLTVCLAVLGKYVPALNFFDRLLSDTPALEAHVWLYHRLLARDRTEANQILVARQKESSNEEVCDELLLPTLQLARDDYANDRISDEDEQFVVASLREMIDDLHTSDDQSEAAGEAAESSPRRISVIGMPFRHRGDELALAMLGETFEENAPGFQVLSTDMLLAERIEAVVKANPACVCITALHPAQLSHVRQLCKRLRAKLPELTIFVGCFGFRGEFDKIRRYLRASGADWVVSSLADLKRRAEPLLEFHSRAETPSSNGATPPAPAPSNSTRAVTAEAR